MPSDSSYRNHTALRAWLRTGLSLVVVGALIAGVSLAAGPRSELDRLLPWIGAGLALVGAASSVGAVIRQRRVLARGRHGADGSEAPALVVAGLIVIAGALLAIIFIADAC